jgi:hypothetical protein
MRFKHILFSAFLSTSALHAIDTSEIVPDLLSGLSFLDSAIQKIECTIAPLNSNREKTIRERKQLSVQESTSTNWSGYAAATSLANPAPGSVNTVYGAWVVPTLSPTPNDTYSSIWVGIDGYGSGSVEQIGTEHDWSNGQQQNYAWYEMYPQDSYEIVGFPLVPGDHISAAVTYIGNNTFQLIIANNTRNVYTSVPTAHTKSSTAQRSSAEWIVEAPSDQTGPLPLADFNQAFMFGCLANINGVIGAINNPHWQNDQLTMVRPSGAIKANTSPLSPTPSDGGSQFLVTWQHE